MKSRAARALAIGVVAVLAVGPRVARANAATTILPLGDSITLGFSPDFPARGGYRGFLDSRLTRAGISHSFVGASTLNPPLGADPQAFRHDGWPGARIEQDAAAIATAPFAADVVVIHLGTNDILQGYDPQAVYPDSHYDGYDPSQRAVFVEHLEGRLNALIAEVLRLQPQARVVVCTIAPTGRLAEDRTVRDYNTAIRAQVMPVLRTIGARVVLADVEQTFLYGRPAGDFGLLSSDGIHPSPRGYQVIAAAVTPAVEQALALP